MEYNKLNSEKHNSDKYVELFSKKKNHDIQNNNLNNLQNKIKELENKIEFYKKYQYKFNNFDDPIIINTISIIDEIILQLNKNIINKSQINRKSKSIEFEFLIN